MTLVRFFLAFTWGGSFGFAASRFFQQGQPEFAFSVIGLYFAILLLMSFIITPK